MDTAVSYVVLYYWNICILDNRTHRTRSSEKLSENKLHAHKKGVGRRNEMGGEGGGVPGNQTG